MCSKVAPPPLPRLKPPTTGGPIKKETTTVKLKPPPSRKTRSKKRKPKYLSLRLELSPENTTHSTTATISDHNQNQLNLFPLHPDHTMEDNLDTHVDNMAESFFPVTDGGAATLTGLLSVAGTTISSSEDLTLSPSSMNYEEGELIRTAMRNKERDTSEEEKWVYYSEVVETKEDEVSSSAAEARRSKMKRLSLKLDYNGIMSAWSDKGSLYIYNTESPQTVPDLHDDDFLSPSAVDGLWSVPDLSIDGKLQLLDQSKASVREASVQRYKEKRQSRLFAKKIRYEVRKLNAEKRPRIKGRFVKRLDR